MSKLSTSEGEVLSALLHRVMKEGLEGLVIKDRLSSYEPSARHWNKIKKDYLSGMADSADLLVLGANYGTGRMGGLMSIFIMGVYDSKTGKYKTVCRVGNGHDDEKIQLLQTELKMVKISHDYSKVPSWLEIHKDFTPDFVIADPKQTQVWEIEGAEFTYSPKHTADSISIRFPRVKRVRDDKDWDSATNLEQLQELVKMSEKVKRLLFKPPSADGEAEEKQEEEGAAEEKEEYLDEWELEEKKKTEEKEEKPSVKKEAKPEPAKKPAKTNPGMGQRTISSLFNKSPTTSPSHNDNAKNPEKEEEDAMATESTNNNNNNNNNKNKSNTKQKGTCFEKPVLLKGAPAAKKPKVVKRSKARTTELKLDNDEPHPNFNEDITNILEQVGINEKNMGHSVKHKAYMKACTALQLYHKRVESGAEAKTLDGIGVKIAKKVDEILATGKLQKLEKAKADPRIQGVNQLCMISGIGPVMALKLVDEHGIKTVKELQKKKDVISLNHHQEIGLKYFDEFQQRIPREEVSQFEKMVKSILHDMEPNLIATICGSYRRKKATCGDIDMLLTHPDFTSAHQTPKFVRILVERLKQIDVLTDDLSLGDHSYHGVCKLPEEGALHRRIDILWIPYDQYYFGLLYFTGSGFFNIQMRRIALEKGFTLNEKEILPIGDTGICGDPVLVESEKEIFDILGMEYKDPENRDLAPNWKPTMS